MGKNILSKMYS